MDFSALVGKTVVWSGSFPSDDPMAADERYMLFSSGAVVKIPEDDSGENMLILDDGIDVLKEHLAKWAPYALNILDLSDQLSEPFTRKTDWRRCHELKRRIAEQENADYVAKIQSMNLPAEEEFKAMMEADIKGLPKNLAVEVAVAGQLEETPVVATAPGKVEEVPQAPTGTSAAMCGMLDALRAQEAAGAANT
jgi:hypothetical protein